MNPAWHSHRAPSFIQARVMSAPLRTSLPPRKHRRVRRQPVLATLCSLKLIIVRAHAPNRICRDGRPGRSHQRLQHCSGTRRARPCFSWSHAECVHTTSWRRWDPHFWLMGWVRPFHLSLFLAFPLAHSPLPTERREYGKTSGKYTSSKGTTKPCGRLCHLRTIGISRVRDLAWAPGSL